MHQTFQISDVISLRRLSLERLGFVATSLGPLLANLPSSVAFDVVRHLLEEQRKRIGELAQLENEWARSGPHQTRAMEAVNRKAASSAELQALDGRADAVVSLACQRLEVDNNLHPAGSAEALANYRLYSTLFAKGAKFLTQQSFSAQLYTYEELANSLQLPSVVGDFAVLHLDGLRLRLIGALNDFVNGARAADLYVTRPEVNYGDLLAARDAAHHAHCDTFVAILAATQADPELRATLIAPYLFADGEARQPRNRTPSTKAPNALEAGTKGVGTEGAGT